mmetsp:Transcript_16774/g.18478  ORF Transcript_16774/g.18478 Transcript_16774/m.18478 type:complete len:115 (-) Transcript_16774:76-420(-)
MKEQKPMMSFKKYRKYSHLDNRMRHLQGLTRCAPTRVELPTIDEDEIGTIIMKNCNNKIQRGEVTHYFEDKKLYFIVYESGDNEKTSCRLLNRYRFTDTDRDRTRQIMRLSTRL